jgi:hypothetical protein
MKLLGETRFDVSDEDAKEHDVPNEERNGLALVFACTPKERVDMMELAESISAKKGEDPKMCVVRAVDLDKLIAKANETRSSLFDIPGVYVRQYNIEQRAPQREYVGMGGGKGFGTAAFRDEVVCISIDFEMRDSDAAQELIKLLQRAPR